MFPATAIGTGTTISPVIPGYPRSARSSLPENPDLGEAPSYRKGQSSPARASRAIEIGSEADRAKRLRRKPGRAWRAPRQPPRSVIAQKCAMENGGGTGERFERPPAIRPAMMEGTFSNEGEQPSSSGSGSGIQRAFGLHSRLGNRSDREVSLGETQTAPFCRLRSLIFECPEFAAAQGRRA